MIKNSALLLICIYYAILFIIVFPLLYVQRAYYKVVIMILDGRKETSKEIDVDQSSDKEYDSRYKH